nr:uncharacterized protein LOC109172590 [Ipomoea trifida]
MPSPPSSAYLTALTLEIERKLQRALALPTQRRDLLQELFADIALEVDDRAKEILFSSENLRSASEEKIKGPICYFDVLADHFIHVADSGKPILSLIVQLWSQQSFACHIFSLLFHKWLFEVELDKSESLLRYSSALVQVDKLEMFLSQFPDFPNAVFIGGPADFFVTEVADQLQKLKVEPVLLHYLSQLKVLRGWAISTAAYKYILPVAISMVLAIFFLELH